MAIGWARALAGRPRLVSDVEVLGMAGQYRPRLRSRLVCGRPGGVDSDARNNRGRTEPHVSLGRDFETWTRQRQVGSWLGHMSPAAKRYVSVKGAHARFRMKIQDCAGGRGHNVCTLLFNVRIAGQGCLQLARSCVQAINPHSGLQDQVLRNIAHCCLFE